MGSAMVGSAVVVAGVDYVTRPGTAYAAITPSDCASGFCTDGYTEFCCAINNGVNACPPNSFAGGWWRADSSTFCGGGTRYYIDCMQNCCGPDLGYCQGGYCFCQGCVECQCANGCGTRRVYCNYFRYGQCHTEIAKSGPIACRVVSCVPPYAFAENACLTTPAVDNSTAEHFANCAVNVDPTPAPAVAAVLASSAVAVPLAGGGVTVLARGRDGAAWWADVAAGSPTWRSLGGLVTSGIALASVASTTTASARGGDGAIYEQVRASDGSWSGWRSLGGGVKSDPVSTVFGGAVFVMARGNNDECFVNRSPSPHQWDGWASLGGSITSEPAVAANGSTLFVAVRGRDNAVYVNRTTGGSWSGWKPLGGGATADPACAADSGGLHLFVRGNDKAIWYAHVDNGGAATAWASLGGGATGDPIAITDGSGAIVFVRGNDNAIWYRRPAPGSWASLGGGASNDPAVTLDADGSTVHIVVQGGDGALYGALSSGGAGWQPLGFSAQPSRVGLVPR
jgi:hypothetical protein